MRRYGSKRGLHRIRHLLRELGDPQERFRSIHVTGTNGKGSTTAMAASILRAAGYEVGMYTSPHLSSFTERIVVGERRIPVKAVVDLVEEVKPFVEEMARIPELGHPTFFEVATAIAFRYFAEEGVDFAVLEAGMGGGLDATNVVHSLVSVITNVGLEHTEVLGKTVLEIAEKKAGITKKEGVLITATQDDGVFSLFREICERVDSRIFRVGRDIRFRKLGSNLEGQRFQLDGLVHRFDELFTPLLGDHQLLNAALAVGAVEALGFHGIEIPRKAMEEGLRMVEWPGRLEIMQRSPTVVLDCAKDPEAARAVKEALLKDFRYARLIAIISISSNKNIPAMIEQIAQVADFFVITAHGVMGRAADPLRIAEEVEKHSKPYEIVKDVKAAVLRAMELARTVDLVLVVGSVFLVGEARELWIKPDEM